MRYLFSLILTAKLSICLSQNIGIGTTAPHTSAQLDLSSINQGFLPPRMSINQRNAINNSVAGLIIYCTDCNDGFGEMNYYNGISWIKISTPSDNSLLDTIPNITIGSQVWSTKNLDAIFYRNGDPIPQVTDPNEWANLTSGAWCYYNNDPSMGRIYGKLYNWYAVNDPRGLAPSGWHIPTNTEWNKLVKYLDIFSDTSIMCLNTVATALKNTWGWSSGGNGSNSSGFTGLPGGCRNNNGIFAVVGDLGDWWSTDEFLPPTNFGSDRILYFSNDALLCANDYRNFGASVRLVKD